jgi:hypothetical protein
MLAGFDPNQIEDIEGAREAIIRILNIVEEISQENKRLRAEVQRLRDENNRLKGEQGQPKVKANKSRQNQDHSSEKERRKPKKRRKKSKIDEIKVDREEVVKVEQASLPEDAEFKGYEPVVVQDIEIKTDNIRFLKEKYYSTSRQESYIAALPVGYQGQFGPGIRSLAMALYYASGMSEPKIKEFLANFNIQISNGQISNLLIKEKDEWHREKDEIYQAGLASSDWQHIDDTGTRVDGVNQYCHIICNPLYTAYFTRPGKDRLTLIKLLQNLPEAQFLLNEQTPDWLETFGVPHWVQLTLQQWPHNIVLSETEMRALVTRDLGPLNDQQQARVLEAAALSAYHQQTTTPIIPLLLSDDAPQFQHLTDEQALCWVHEGRHYKKLVPTVAYHQQLLADFLTDFWSFYHQLQRYRASPSLAQAQQLSYQFDTLFSTVTGYEALDKRIAKTKAKKDKLLMVLKYPQIPLHNNPAELGARQRVRKRDVSFGPRTQDGVAAWDTFMTLAATAKKLGVSFFAYIYDRVSEAYLLPSLAELIRQQSSAIHPAFCE